MKTFFSKSNWVIMVMLIVFSTTVFSQNILYNGDFEVLNPDNPSMPDNWWIEYCSTPDFTTFSVDADVKHSGNYSFKVTTIAGKTSGDCVVMPSADPDTMYMGGLYKISFWTKTEGQDVWSNMDVLWASWIEGVGGTTDWTYIEAVYPYKGGLEPAHFLSLWFNADSCALAGTAWFDDVTVEYLGTPPSAPEELSLIGDFVNDQVVLNWGASTPGSADIDYYLIKKVKRGAETPNICPNPGLEDPNEANDFAADWGTFYWSSADQQSWVEDTVRSGYSSVTISSALGGHAFISTGLVPPAGTRGFDVYMKAYIKTENIVGGSGAFIDFQGWYGLKQGLFGTNDWTADDAVAVNVLPGSTCGLMFGNYGDSWGGDYPDEKSSGQAWYDDVSVVLFDSIGQTTGLTLTDADVVANETYYYSVRAVDTDGLLGDAQMVTVLASGGNVLYNGDFEVLNPDNPSMPDNWWIEYCGTPDVTTISIDDQVKHSGNYSFKFTTIAGKTSGDCVVMPSAAPDSLYSNAIYKVSYWVKTEGVGVYNVSIRCDWGGGIYNNWYIGDQLVGTNDWTYVEATLVFPKDAREPALSDHFLSLWFNADSCAVAGSAWYDDISVEYIGMPPTSPKNFSATYEDDATVTLDWGPASGSVNPVAYYMIKKVKKGTETPNICVNPGFEDPNASFTFPATWATFFWASAKQEWADDVARTGDASVTMYTVDTPGIAFISKGLFPPAGTRGFDVYAKAYIKTDNVVNGSGAFIDFQSWSGTKIGIYGTNDWTADDVVRADVTPGTPLAVEFGNYRDGRGAPYTDTKPTGQAWYDDVSVVLFDSIGQATSTIFTDTDVVPGETYYYTVRSVDNRGLFGDAQIDTIEATPTAIEDQNVLVPRKTELVGNYPNPFNPTTTLVFNLEKSSNVKISVYNMLGQKVTEVVNKDYQAGEYRVQWNAGSGISSGIYFYELRAGDFTQIKKMILLR